MMYEKPKDLTYTDLCIYVDEHVYEDNHDVELVYKYIYLIVLMLAQQGRVFEKHKYYDPFALYAATRIYLRLTNKKQYELDRNGEPKMVRIKSVLNYAKRVLYPMKVDFEQSEYAQSLGPVVEDSSFNYESVVRTSLDGIALVEFNMTLDDVNKTCKHFLKSIPYKQTSSEWLNIYTSVMLTFLNMVTLSKSHQKYIQYLQENNSLTDRKLATDFNEEYNMKPILFHVDESMSDYILVLARQLRYIISEDLSNILHTSMDRDFVLADVQAGEFYYGQDDADEDKI